MTACDVDTHPLTEMEWCIRTTSMLFLQDLSQAACNVVPHLYHSAAVVK